VPGELNDDRRFLNLNWLLTQFHCCSSSVLFRVIVVCLFVCFVWTTATLSVCVIFIDNRFNPVAVALTDSRRRRQETSTWCIENGASELALLRTSVLTLCRHVVSIKAAFLRFSNESFLQTLG
jgi:hypothetical protein